MLDQLALQQKVMRTMSSPRLESDRPVHAGAIVRLPAFTAVRFMHGVEAGGLTIPQGTRGIIVDIYDGAYGVELPEPFDDVVIVGSNDLAPA